MSEIEFEDKSNNRNSLYLSRKLLGDPEKPAMVKTIMQLFRFRNEKVAGNFLILTTFICFCFTVFFCIKLFYVSPEGKAIVNQNLPENLKSILPQ